MILKKIYNRHIPAKGFTAMTVYPFVFVRRDLAWRFNSIVKRHETTHALQQVETLWVLFLVVYGLEWLLKLPFCKFDTSRAYRSISFEQEAFIHQYEDSYNQQRRHYAWLKNLFTLKK